MTITLPSALGNAGAEIIIKEVASKQEALTIAAGAGQKVDGAPSFDHARHHELLGAARVRRRFAQRLR